MFEAKKQGLVKHIGVSNFSIKKLKDLLDKTEVYPGNESSRTPPLFITK
ncbi:aldo/keto reductase [Mesonia sp. HuA40]|nr:aldo/keto reductase [Mesonia sp. HuA40]